MRPANPTFRAEVDRIVQSKINDGRKRSPFNYAEIAALCKVKRGTLARAVCLELRKRKSISSTGNNPQNV